MTDSRNPRDGRFIERVGFYDPKAPAGRESLRFNLDRVTHWQGKGAKVSDTVARLLRQLPPASARRPPEAVDRGPASRWTEGFRFVGTFFCWARAGWLGADTAGGIVASGRDRAGSVVAPMVIMGRVVAPFAVKGWIRVQPFTQLPANLLDYPVWWLGGEGNWTSRAAGGRRCAWQVRGREARGLRRARGGRGAAGPGGGGAAQPAASRASQASTTGPTCWAWRSATCEGADAGTRRALLETGANQVLVVRWGAGSA